MKKCNGACQEEKDESEFTIKRYKNGSIGLRSRCKSCSKLDRDLWRKSSSKDNDRNKLYNKTHARRIRGKKLQRYWPGLTWQQALEEWKLLYTLQDGHCYICPRSLILHVDHCHKTHKVRGLLCNKCNRGIGMMNDDPVLLARAIDYLNKHT